MTREATNDRSRSGAGAVSVRALLTKLAGRRSEARDYETLGARSAGSGCQVRPTAQWPIMAIAARDSGRRRAKGCRRDNQSAVSLMMAGRRATRRGRPGRKVKPVTSGFLLRARLVSLIIRVGCAAIPLPSDCVGRGSGWLACRGRFAAAAAAARRTRVVARPTRRRRRRAASFSGELHTLTHTA